MNRKWEGLAEALPVRSEVSDIHQCRTCPWRIDCDPERDIPNGYSVELHAALTDTIARPDEINLGPIRVMACHYSPIGEERFCAGWLYNQLGDGSNIGLRIAASSGRVPVPVVCGAQHERFEDTLPAGRER